CNLGGIIISPPAALSAPDFPPPYSDYHQPAAQRPQSPGSATDMAHRCSGASGDYRTPHEQSKVEGRKSKARKGRSAAFSTFNFQLFNFGCICNKPNDLLNRLGRGRGGVEWRSASAIRRRRFAPLDLRTEFPNVHARKPTAQCTLRNQRRQGSHRRAPGGIRAG